MYGGGGGGGHLNSKNSALFEDLPLAYQYYHSFKAPKVNVDDNYCCSSFNSVMYAVSHVSLDNSKRAQCFLSVPLPGISLRTKY